MEQAGSSTEIVTILITDLVGSTALGSRTKPEQADRLRREHFGLLREATHAFGGREVKNTGDGLMCAFPSSSSAIASAIQMQQLIERRNRSGGERLQMRVGIGAGEATAEDGDYFGMPTIEAARLCDQAQEDCILVSSLARMMASQYEDLRFESAGSLELKGIPQPIEAFSVAWEPLEPATVGVLEDNAGVLQASDAPLLERDREVDALSAAISEAGAGKSALVMVEGPAGIGKSRLLGHAAQQATASEMVLLRSRGAELERDYSWGVVRQLFERWLLDQDASNREHLLEGPAETASVALGRAAVDGDREAFAAVHGLYWLAANIAEERPLALIIDDLQWADEASLRWLAYIASRLDGLAVALLVGVRRPDPSADREPLQRLSVEAGTRNLRPKPLSPEATRELVTARRNLTGEWELATACHQATGGNPFLLGALLDDLSELAHEGPLDPASVRALRSEEITRSVLLRLGRLSQEARNLARASAILGGSSTSARAAALAEVAPEDASTAVAALCAAGVLADGAPLSFVHPVVHSVVLHDMSAHERSAWHARAAAVLLDSEGTLQEIAAQLLHVEPSADEAAVQLLIKAATAALSAGAPEEGGALLRRAEKEPPSESSRASVKRLLGRALIRADGAAGLEPMRAAVEMTASPYQRAETALELGRALEGLSRNLEATEVYHRALLEYGEADDALTRNLEAGLAVAAAQHLSTLPRAQEIVAVASARDQGKTPANAVIRAVMALGATAAGAPEGVEMAADALQGEELFEADTSIAVGLAAAPLAWGDRLDAALEVWDEVTARAQRRGATLRYAFGLAFRAEVQKRAGRLADAEADARASLSLPEEMWVAAAPPVDAMAILAETLIESGALEEAESMLGSVGPADAMTDYQGNNLLLLARGRLRLAQGDSKRAEEDLLELGRRCEAWTLRNPAALPWRSQAALALRDRDPARAIELAEEEHELAAAFGAPRAIGISLRALGLLVKGKASIERLGEAVEVLSTSPAPLELSRALVDLGAAERRAGQRVSARRTLAEGMDAAAACGAQPLVERARAELAAAGSRPRRDRITGRDALTVSERRVAAMAAEGKTNREIAQSQWVTLSTVETHLTHVYSKLGISKRTQLPDALENEQAVSGTNSSG